MHCWRTRVFFNDQDEKSEYRVSYLVSIIDFLPHPLGRDTFLKIFEAR
jgi:hypothetical protein